ncbi:acyl-CoA dehydrogenase family protein [Nocardia arthritidis]|uniref:Acyl-CoA dehydrogenase n=1 Tax=Nocardia arthritidis TaxID=228602 RepID=A0A6G9YG97_9NOCA|nr:acyl-CoA dehydrogenase family protein [Nocardia arthritidis]QIS11993.1 acyl-CoA dehydrogenase [Nocardia arthritidis]
MSIVADSSIDRIGLARRIAATFRRGVAQRDRSGEISVAAFDLLRATGLTAALVPAEFGGGAATHREMGAILREIGAHDPSTAVAFARHCQLVATQVWRHRHGLDARALFEKVVDGAILVGTYAADWVESNGRAERDAGGYRVSARKERVGGCEVGSILVTSIRHGDAPGGPEVLHCSIPLGSTGMRIEKTGDAVGLRASGGHTVVLDEVYVPDSAIESARPAGEWPALLNVVVGSGTPLVLSAYLGIADSAIDLATALIAEESAAHTFQLAGEMLNAHTTAADLIAAMFTDSDDLTFDASDAHAGRTLSRKTVAADALVNTVRLAIEATGGTGYSRGCDLEMWYRDMHGCLFDPLPRAEQTRFAGRTLLGHSPIG